MLLWCYYQFRFFVSNSFFFLVFFRHWQELGFLIVYVTSRPDFQKIKVMSWLAEHNFPYGLVSFGNGISKDIQRHKTEFLRYLANEVSNFSMQEVIQLSGSFTFYFIVRWGHIALNFKKCILKSSLILVLRPLWFNSFGCIWGRDKRSRDQNLDLSSRKLPAFTHVKPAKEFSSFVVRSIFSKDTPIVIPLRLVCSRY